MLTLARGIRIDSSKGLFTPTMKELAAFWKVMLLDLIRLKDDEISGFWTKHWYFRQRPTDSELLDYREKVKLFWGGDSQILGTILVDFVYDSTREHRKPLIVDRSASGTLRIVPDYRIFALSLALAINKFQAHMSVCGNSGCQDYFISSRRTQKYCYRPACLEYGQREQKRAWWIKNGKEWRRSKESKRRKK